jgi:hypothetical protein
MGLILAGYLSLLCAQHVPPIRISSDDASLSLVCLQTKDVDTDYQVELEIVRGEATPQQTATTTVDGRSQESGRCMKAGVFRFESTVSTSRDSNMQGFSQQSLHLATRFSNGMTSVKDDKGDGRDAVSDHRRKFVCK